MNTLQLGRSAALASALLFLQACASGPMEAYSTNMFNSPPEIHHVNGQYLLYIDERTMERETVGNIVVQTAGQNLQVYVGEMITIMHERNGPKIIPLTIPPAFAGKDLTHRFFWLDPDNSVHPITVLTDAASG